MLMHMPKAEPRTHPTCLCGIFDRKPQSSDTPSTTTSRTGAGLDIPQGVPLRRTQSIQDKPPRAMKQLNTGVFRRTKSNPDLRSSPRHSPSIPIIRRISASTVQNPSIDSIRQPTQLDRLSVNVDDRPVQAKYEAWPGFDSVSPVSASSTPSAQRRGSMFQNPFQPTPEESTKASKREEDPSHLEWATEFVNDSSSSTGSLCCNRRNRSLVGHVAESASRFALTLKEKEIERERKASAG